MEKVPNPARWLLRVWDRLSPNLSQTALIGWAVTFGLEPNDPRVLSAIFAMMNIVERTKRASDLLGLPQGIKTQIAPWSDAFDRVVQRAASGESWQHTRGQFTDVRREKLEMCANWLDHGGCASVDETDSEVRDLNSELASLQEAVRDADGLDHEFRELLLDILETLRRAIAEYNMRGMQGVEAALGEIFATIWRRQEAWKKGTKDWKARAWDAVNRASKLGGLVRLGVLASEFGKLLLDHIP
jgi:hypothetical protein